MYIWKLKLVDTCINICSNHLYKQVNKPHPIHVIYINSSDVV